MLSKVKKDQPPPIEPRYSKRKNSLTDESSLSSSSSSVHSDDSLSPALNKTQSTMTDLNLTDDEKQINKTTNPVHSDEPPAPVQPQVSQKKGKGKKGKAAKQSEAPPVEQPKSSEPTQTDQEIALYELEQAAEALRALSLASEKQTESNVKQEKPVDQPTQRKKDTPHKYVSFAEPEKPTVEFKEQEDPVHKKSKKKKSAQRPHSEISSIAEEDEQDESEAIPPIKSDIVEDSKDEMDEENDVVPELVKAPATKALSKKAKAKKKKAAQKAAQAASSSKMESSGTSQQTDSDDERKLQARQHYSNLAPPENLHYTISSDRNVLQLGNKMYINRERMLTAKRGTGIAATGLTDKFPWERPDGMHPDDGLRMFWYSDLVGKKFDWREELDIINKREVEGDISEQIKNEWIDISMEKLGLFQMLNQSMTLCPRLKVVLLAILDGDVEKVKNSLELPEDPSDPKNPYPQHSMIQGILSYLENPENGMNAIMYLCTDICLTHFKKTKICCMDKDHPNCTLLSLLLSNLRPDAARAWVRKTTKNTQRSCLHFACIAGGVCHIQVLAGYVGNLDLNRKDYTNRAAIHYCLMRNAPQTLRQLMWLGADLSLTDRFAINPIFEAAPRGQEAMTYLKDRMDALNRAMNSWLTYCFDGVFKVFASATDLHTVKLETVNSACVSFAVKNKELKFAQAFDNMNLMLFAVPIQWTWFDPFMPGKYPHVVRQNLKIVDYPESTANIFPRNPLLHQQLQGKTISEYLKPSLPNIDCGIYAWWIPKDLNPANPTITFAIDIGQLSEQQSKISSVIFQIYAVTCEDGRQATPGLKTKKD